MTKSGLTDDRGFVADVADVQQRGQQLDDVPDLLVREHEHLHGRTDVCKLRRVVAALARDAATLRRTIHVEKFYTQSPRVNYIMFESWHYF